MNLGEIRSAIFSQADWSPKQSSDAKTRVNEFINRAYFSFLRNVLGLQRSMMSSRIQPLFEMLLGILLTLLIQ